MALFKIFRGVKENLPKRENSKDGYCYFTTDDALLYIDYGSDGRKPLNAGAVVETNNGLEQKFWRGTQEQYDELADHADDTLYIITNPNQSSGNIATEIVLFD
jgi:hypothetical protein